MNLVALTFRRMWRKLPVALTDRLRALPPLAQLRRTVSHIKYRNMTHDEIYGADYFRFVDKTTNASRDVLADSIMATFAPSVAVDVGCGTGSLLEALRDRGVQVRGLEYASAALEFCRQRRLDVMPCDLTSAATVDLGKADVVISMEVAQSLPESCADDYVDLLCRTADNVVFSSDTPGGGDQLARNEQPHAYWIDKFAQRGYDYLDDVTSEWRANWKAHGAASWFHHNLLLFRKRG